MSAVETTSPQKLLADLPVLFESTASSTATIDIRLPHQETFNLKAHTVKGAAQECQIMAKKLHFLGQKQLSFDWSIASHKLAPNDIQNIRYIAIALYKDRHFGEALPFLRQWAGVEPGNEPVLGMLSHSLREEKLYKEAIPYLKTLVNINKSNTHFLGVLAHSLYQELEYKEAIPHFEILVKKDPDNIAHLSMFALCLLREDRDEEAILHFESLNEKEPKNPSTLGALGDLYIRNGRLDEAVASFSVLYQIEITSDNLNRLNHAQKMLQNKIEADYENSGDHTFTIS